LVETGSAEVGDVVVAIGSAVEVSVVGSSLKYWLSVACNSAATYPQVALCHAFALTGECRAASWMAPANSVS